MPMESSIRVASNIIKYYGKDRFVRLLSLLESNASGADIAKEFGVTRQRVNQWKHILGVEKVEYTTNSDVKALAQ